MPELRDPARPPTEGPAARAPKPRLPSEDERLDEALADSFPASDPPASTNPTRKVRRGRAPMPAGRA